VEGNGQTELIEALAGLVPAARVAGSVLLEAKDVTHLGAGERKGLGIAHIPEDRHRRGLLLDFDLSENSILGVQDRRPLVAGPGGIWLNHAAIRDRALRIVKEFDVRPPNPDLPARALSGGNQQKLILGRELGLHPKVLLVAQPTRGVDIGAIEFIHRQIVALRDAGGAVLLVSAELEEVTALSDRLLVLHQGKIAGEVDPASTPATEIGLLMTGGSIAA
jgi:simple sugar transport system ATP-binding protein